MSTYNRSIDLTGEEFKAWLEKYRLPTTNAARIFNVTDATGFLWIERGVRGPAASYIRFLMSYEIPPQAIADRLRIAISTGQRKSHHRSKGARDLAERVASRLRDRGGRMSRRDLMRSLGGVRVDDISEAIKSLESENIVTVKKITPEQGGAPTIWVKLID